VLEELKQKKARLAARHAELTSIIEEAREEQMKRMNM